MAQYKIKDLFTVTTYIAAILGFGNLLFASEPFFAILCGTVSAGITVIAILYNSKLAAAISESFFLLCVIRLMSELWRVLDLWVQ